MSELIKMFVSDLDGTLFQGQIGVSEEDKAALNNLHDQGVEICIATGRQDDEILDVANQLGFPVHRISQNGAYVFDKNGKLLYEAAFSLRTAKKIYEAGKPFDFACQVSIGQNIYTTKITKHTASVADRLLVPLIHDPDLWEKINEQNVPGKISFIGELDQILEL